VPERESQVFTISSEPPEASCRPSGLNASPRFRERPASRVAGLGVSGECQPVEMAQLPAIRPLPVPAGMGTLFQQVFGNPTLLSCHSRWARPHPVDVELMGERLCFLGCLTGFCLGAIPLPFARAKLASALPTARRCLRSPRRWKPVQWWQARRDRRSPPCPLDARLDSRHRPRHNRLARQDAPSPSASAGRRKIPLSGSFSRHFRPTVSQNRAGMTHLSRRGGTGSC